MFEVLQSFKYAPSILEVKEFSKGDIVAIPPETAKDLLKEKYIKESKQIVDKVVDQIETPQEPPLETNVMPALSRRRNK